MGLKTEAIDYTKDLLSTVVPVISHSFYYLMENVFYFYF